MNIDDLLPALLIAIEAGTPERQALFETVMSAPQCATSSLRLLQGLEWALHLHRMKATPVPDTPVPSDFDTPSNIVALSAATREVTEESGDAMYRRLLKALKANG